MAKETNVWHKYHENTKERPPRESLTQALALVYQRDAALDLGAGALRDTNCLLQSGFKKVIAVDSEPSVIDRATQLDSSRLEVIISHFENYDFPPNTFNIINAQFALPFTDPAFFNVVFERLKDSLKKDGIFVGQLFGVNDTWSTNPEMTFHTYEEVKQLFSDLKIIELHEQEEDGTTASGKQKHWHIFQILAQK